MAEPARGIMAAGLGIAMTDLFVSATAALLVVIALSRPIQIENPPIQADFLLFCPSVTAPGGYVLFSAGAVRDIGFGQRELDASLGVEVAAKPGLGEAVLALQPTAKPFYSIALVGNAARPLTAACLRDATRKLVAPHNRMGNRKGALRSVVAIEPVPDIVEILTASVPGNE